MRVFLTRPIETRVLKCAAGNIPFNAPIIRPAIAYTGGAAPPNLAWVAVERFAFFVQSRVKHGVIGQGVHINQPLFAANERAILIAIMRETPAPARMFLLFHPGWKRAFQPLDLVFRRRNCCPITCRRRARTLPAEIARDFRAENNAAPRWSERLQRRPKNRQLARLRSDNRLRGGKRCDEGR